MITLMTLTASKSRDAKQWLQKNHLAYHIRDIRRQHLTKKDIYHLLQMSENGFDDLLSHHRSSAKKRNSYDNLSCQELINQIISRPGLMKFPIIYDEHKLQVGWNENEMGKFISSAKRRHDLRTIMGDDYHILSTEMMRTTDSPYHVYI